jgi:hypothetical protein
MNFKFWKPLSLTFGLASAFTLCMGLSNSAFVFAQSSRSQCPISRQEWARREEILRSRGWDGRLNRYGNVDLNGNGIDDRYEINPSYCDRYSYDRYGYRAHENYPYYNYSYNNRGYYRGSRYDNFEYSNEVNHGYQDGLQRGREDVSDDRRPDPNNSSHYRKGSSAYREGFLRGYWQGYRQYLD